MKLYYKKVDAEATKLGESKCSRIKCFTLKKLGDKLDSPDLKAKGSQSRCMVRFCTELLAEHALKTGLEGKLLQRSGLSLMEYYHIMRNEHRKVLQDMQIRLMSACLNHIQLYKKAGGRMVPKHHGMVHLTQSVCTSGNPAYYSTYEDESENGVVAGVGIVVHGLTWIKSVFERLELMQDLDDT